jgi:SAM-dependent methyltransferase
MTEEDLSAAARDEYDRIASVYGSIADDNLANAGFERPELRSMLPAVAGKDVLDAGCAAGSHSEWLAEQGARVVAVDISPRMVQLARGRLGDRADVRVHDLAAPLDFLDDDSMDVVVSSLTIHYLTELLPTFREFNRILRPDGSFVFSTHHPFIDWQWFDLPSYYTTARVTDHWPRFDATLSFRRRTVEEILRAVFEAGFVVRQYREPKPTAEARARWPAENEDWGDEPTFLFIEAVPA